MSDSKKQAARRNYEPNKRKVSQLVFSGLVATAMMDGMALLLPHGELPPDLSTPTWPFGITSHLIAGSALFPIAGDYLVDRQVLPQRRWLKGLLWGATLWASFEAIAKPLAGLGLFSSRMPDPAASSMISLVCWLTYGAVLDGVTRQVRFAHDLGIGEKAAASKKQAA